MKKLQQANKQKSNLETKEDLEDYFDKEKPIKLLNNISDASLTELELELQNPKEKIRLTDMTFVEKNYFIQIEEGKPTKEIDVYGSGLQKDSHISMDFIRFVVTVSKEVLLGILATMLTSEQLAFARDLYS